MFINPGTGNMSQFSTNFNPGEFARIAIYNQLGVQLKNLRVNEKSEKISFDPPLHPGIYFFEIF